MRAFPSLGQRPAPTVTDRPDETVVGLIEFHLAVFDQNEASVRTGEEDEPEIDESAVGHDAARASEAVYCCSSARVERRGLRLRGRRLRACSEGVAQQQFDGS